MEKIKKPEILAPAGSMESLKAAVAAGCDAVYIGGSRFGARAYADNPQGDEMLEAIHYCHLYGKKIYMTVNTLLKQDELEEDLYDYLLPYYEAGLDAAIVQDVGVMRYLHRCFPELELHASTQMTITMGVSQEILKEYGVTRIVPARELTLKELGRMRKDTSMELEIFVHGALCYCYSGQCLFSSMLGNRSGNRGRCAQPCRMAYRMLDDKGNKKNWEQAGPYILSPKENCNLSHIGDLMEIGVNSLKIEGRMKRPEYTAYTTAMYRKYVDLYASLGKAGYEKYLREHQPEWQEDLRKLSELYNRDGFTQGYFEGKAGVPLEAKKEERGSMLSSWRPKHGGVLVGKVTSVDKHTVTYKALKDIHSQDVVEFRSNTSMTEYEYTLGEDKRSGTMVTSRYLKGSKISVGDGVYRTKDAPLLEDIRSRFVDSEAKIKVNCEFQAVKDQPMKLTLTTKGQDGKELTLVTEGTVCQEAKKQPATEESVKKCLVQTGGTCFIMEKCNVELLGNLFLPVGNLKKLRRSALEELEQKITEPPKRKVLPENCTKDQWGEETQEELFAQVRTVEQLDAALTIPKVTRIYVKMESLSDEKIKAAIEKIVEQGKAAYVVLPRIFRENVYDLEKKKFSQGTSLYTNSKISGFLIQNMESYVFLTLEAHIPAEKIQLENNLYVTNRESWQYWREQGCEEMTLPLELSGDELGSISHLPGMQMVVYGKMPLMVSAQCVRFNTSGCLQKQGKHTEQAQWMAMEDERARKFLLFSNCKYCYNMIYGQEPLVLLEQKKELMDNGVFKFRYDFTLESGEEVKKILNYDDAKGQTGHYYSGIM